MTTTSEKLPCSSHAEMDDALVRLSAERGGAWVAVPMPFMQPGDAVEFRQFRSPSKVPDRYIQSCNPFHKPLIGYRGRLVDFTEAAKIREQNRGFGHD